MTDIVERLRELEAVESELACECDCPPEATANYRYAMTCAEAADTITTLRAENERLRAALREVMDDLTLISKNHWLPVGLLDDVIYVNARAALDGQPRAGEGGVMEYSIELWQDGQKVAAVHSDSASNALWAIAGYAAQYEQDGPVTVRVKNKNKNKKRKTAND